MILLTTYLLIGILVGSRAFGVALRTFGAETLEPDEPYHISDVVMALIVALLACGCFLVFGELRARAHGPRPANETRCTPVRRSNPFQVSRRASICSHRMRPPES